MFTRILSVIFTSLATDSAAEMRYRFERQLMGTGFVVTCYADNEDIARKASNAAFEVAEKLNGIASDYLPESELSKLSSKNTDEPISLSPELYQLLDFSRQMAEATNGAFDPTLGPLTRLWRESRDLHRLQEPERIQLALSRVGWRNFTLDSRTSTITLRKSGMAFDLGGIAKGYAADLMLRSLEKSGIHKAIVVAGGDIRLGDPPPGRDGWKVALKTFDRFQMDEVMTLSNAAVSTSGDLYQSIEIDGIHYSHILDPKTGVGLTKRIAATVIADEGKISDPLSTAACVLGVDACGMLRDIPGFRELKLRTPQKSLNIVGKKHSITQ